MITRAKIIDKAATLMSFDFLKRWLPQQFAVYGHLVFNREHPVNDYYRYPSLEEFKWFVNTFKRLGYAFVDVRSYFHNDGKKKILLTFDDGFKVVYDYLHPYLLDEKIPYVLFAMSQPLVDPSFYIKTIKPRPDFKDRLFVNVEELASLKESGVHIGFHTRTHMPLTTDGDKVSDEVIQEMSIPNEFKSLLSEPGCFAYPYLAPDRYNALDKQLKRLGYEFFFDTKGFHTNDGNHIFRVTIDGEKQVSASNVIEHVLKRQLLLRMLRAIR